MEKVRCGENIKVKLKGVDESDISPGFMLCDPHNPVKSCRVFDAQVRARFYRVTLRIEDYILMTLIG